MNNYQSPDYSYGAQPGPYTTPPPPAPQRPNKMPRWVKALLIIVAVPVVAVGGCTAMVAGFGLANEAADKAPVASGTSTYDPGINTPPTAGKSTRKPVEEAPPTVPSDGTLLVGKDVKAGTYQTRVPAGDVPSCYWARLRDLDGDVHSITDNDIKMTVGALVTLRVRSTDYAVEINCHGATWTRVK